MSNESDDPVTHESIKTLISSIVTLEEQLEDTGKSLKAYAPRNEVDDLVRSQVHGLELQVDKALSTLIEATAEAAKAAAVANESVWHINRTTKSDFLRFSKLGRFACSMAIAFMSLGIMTSAIVIDLHTHTAHIEPMEQRVEAIEALIARVDEEMTDGALPDLEGERFVTSDLIPLSPASEQGRFPIGLTFMGLQLILILLFGFLAGRNWPGRKEN